MAQYFHYICWCVFQFLFIVFPKLSYEFFFQFHCTLTVLCLGYSQSYTQRGVARPSLTQWGVWVGVGGGKGCVSGWWMVKVEVGGRLEPFWPFEAEIMVGHAGASVFQAMVLSCCRHEYESGDSTTELPVGVQAMVLSCWLKLTNKDVAISDHRTTSRAMDKAKDKGQGEKSKGASRLAGTAHHGSAKQQARQSKKRQTAKKIKNPWGHCPPQRCEQCEQTTHDLEKDIDEETQEPCYLQWTKTNNVKVKGPNGRVKEEKRPNGCECYKCYDTRRYFEGQSMDQLKKLRETNKDVDVRFCQIRMSKVRGTNYHKTQEKIDVSRLTENSNDKGVMEYEEGTQEDIWEFCADRRLKVSQKTHTVDDLKILIAEKFPAYKVRKDLEGNPIVCVPDLPAGSTKKRYRVYKDESTASVKVEAHKSSSEMKEHMNHLCGKRDRKLADDDFDELQRTRTSQPQDEDVSVLKKRLLM